MARYIDADELREKFICGIRVFNGKCTVANIIKSIDGMPTADVVEVVRCKDCKHRDEMCMCCHPRHEGILPLTYPLDFCSYGERKW